MELNVFALILMFMEGNIFSNVNKRFCKKKKKKRKERENNGPSPKQFI